MGFYRRTFVFISFLLILMHKSGESQTLQIESMAIKSSGYAVSGAWVLDSNGYVADSVYFSGDGFYKDIAFYGS